MNVRKKNGSKYYYAQFSVMGRFYSRSTRTTDKTLAMQIARQMREDIIRGRHGIRSDKGLSIDELRSRYLVWLKLERSPETHDRARRALENVLDRLKLRFPDELTRERLTKYKEQRLNEVSNVTVALELRHLKAFLRRCVREGWIPSTPCEIEMPKLPTRGRIVFLKEDEIEIFLANLKPWARWAAYLVLNTGLRAEEARFLEWEDVDLQGGYLWVRNKPHLQFRPKNAKERAVPLSPELISELSACQRESGWVVRGFDGNQMNKWTFKQEIAEGGKRAGLSKRVTPHVLRHTFGSLLAMAGVPLPTIKELMGHASISTTMVYVHLSAEHRREAVGKLKIPTLKEKEEKVIPFGG
jgi:integrase/recombinase XerD